MGVRTVRRMAADIMSIGTSRIWFDPERLEDIEAALTRGDVRRLIKDGAIKKRPASTPSRGRKRSIRKARAKGRRSGAGSRKGGVSRTTPWIDKVRAQRKLLKELRLKGEVPRKVYRSLYYKVKGGVFESRRDLLDRVKSLREPMERRGSRGP